MRGMLKEAPNERPSAAEVNDCFSFPPAVADDNVFCSCSCSNLVGWHGNGDPFGLTSSLLNCVLASGTQKYLQVLRARGGRVCLRKRCVAYSRHKLTVCPRAGWLSPMVRLGKPWPLDFRQPHAACRHEEKGRSSTRKAGKGATRQDFELHPKLCRGLIPTSVRQPFRIDTMYDRAQQLSPL